MAGLGDPCNPAGAKTCNEGLSCVGNAAGTSGYCCEKTAAECDSTKGFSCAIAGKEGQCLRKQGIACVGAADCGSGRCVDGVCCDSACTGQCEACDVPDGDGNKGKCTPVAGKPHGARAACSAPANEPCKAAACDGMETTICKAYVGTATECRAASCKDGKLEPRATCDGKGTCSTQPAVECGGFACADVTACRTTCAAAADCVPGLSCDQKTRTCVKITARCEGDVSINDTEGTRQECAPYRCLPNGACATSCASSSECQAGFLCGGARCEPAQPPTEEAGGCTVSRTAGTSATGWLAAMALVAALARRRSARTRPSNTEW